MAFNCINVWTNQLINNFVVIDLKRTLRLVTNNIFVIFFNKLQIRIPNTSNKYSYDHSEINKFIKFFREQSLNINYLLSKRI